MGVQKKNKQTNKQTNIHTQYESSGPCGFGEDIFLCFSHCKSMGAIFCHGNQSSDPTWPKT